MIHLLDFLQNCDFFRKPYLSDRQSSFIFYLVHQGKGRTEPARLAGFAAPKQSAFNLTQSPKIIAKIQQEQNKVLPNRACVYCC